MLLRNVGICLHIHIASKPEKNIVVSSFRLRTYLYTLITTNFVSLVLPPLLRKFVFNFYTLISQKKLPTFIYAL